jgi:hypothetical protein
VIIMTPNRSAGRIEDPLWAAFLAEARKRKMTNTDAIREALRKWLPEPPPDDVP